MSGSPLYYGNVVEARIGSRGGTRPHASDLDEKDWPMWLEEVEGDCAALLRPGPDGLLRVWPVDRRVGSPRNNGPELL